MFRKTYQTVQQDQNATEIVSETKRQSNQTEVHSKHYDRNREHSHGKCIDIFF